MDGTQNVSDGSIESQGSGHQEPLQQQQQNNEKKLEFLVPISVLHDVTANEPAIQSIAWSLVDTQTGRTLSSSTQAVGREPIKLAAAIEQIEADTKDKHCALVACGPAHLRQHLFPACLQANLELTDLFSGYVDLCKEFQDKYKRSNRTCCSLSTSSSSASSCSASSAYVSMGADSLAGFCYCNSPDYHSTNGFVCNGPINLGYRPDLVYPGAGYLADGGASNALSKHPQQQQLQHQQAGEPATLGGHQISSHARRLLEDMLKFLSISNGESDYESELETRCDNCRPKDNIDQQEMLIEDQKRSEHCCPYCSSATNSEIVSAMSLIIERMLNEGHHFSRLERISRHLEVGLCESVSLDNTEQTVVRARGLPWQATEQNIADFFVGLNIAKGGVGLCLSRQGRRNGEALIRFENQEHRTLALARHKHFMGSRYIEVYRASNEDFLSVVAGYTSKAHAFLSKGAQVIVRMRGLPFSCTQQQVLDFFTNESKENKCEVLGNEDGILFVKNQDDKPTGDAFVLFATEQYAQRALQKHHQNIGSRYVELFRSTISEVQQVLNISMESVTSASHKVSNIPSSSSCQQQQLTSRQRNQNASQKQPNGRHKEPTVSILPAQTSAGGVTYAQVANSKLVKDSEDTATITTTTATTAVTTTKTGESLMDKIKRARSPTAQEQRHDSSIASTVPANTCNNSPVSSNILQTSGSDMSAFENNSLNSSLETNELVAPADQLPSSTGSSGSQAQSPISSSSAASTASSYYRSRHTHNNSGVSSGSNNGYSRMGSRHYAGQSGAANPMSVYQQHHNHQAATYVNQRHYPHHLAPMAAYPAPPYAAHHHPMAYPAHSFPAGPPMYTPAYESSKRDCIRLRGLPFEALVEDVLYFLGEHSKNILYQGIHMVYSAQGQPSGEAIIQMSSCQAASMAALEFHKKVMSVGKKQRYIEVIPCSIDDMNLMLGLGLLGRSLLPTPAATPLPQHHPHQHSHHGPAYSSGPYRMPVYPGGQHQPTHPQQETLVHQQQQQQPFMQPPTQFTCPTEHHFSPQATFVAPAPSSGVTATESATVGVGELDPQAAANQGADCQPQERLHLQEQLADSTSKLVALQANQVPSPNTPTYYPVLYYYPQQVLAAPYH